MKIAIISDIHGNLDALEKVLASVDSRKVDEIYCLGDIVGYGPNPNECIDLVHSRCKVVVLGNHDYGAVDGLPLSHFNQFGRAAIRWTKKVLTTEHTLYLRRLPFTLATNEITLVHATPHNPELWHYLTSWAEAEIAFTAFSTPVCFVGHVHVTSVIGADRKLDLFRKEVKHLINVGSVGQPRDGNPHASYGILDTDSWTYENVRVPYDVEKVAKAIMAQKLPDFLAERLFLGV